MKKLQRTELLLVIAAGALALSMLLMIAIMPGILNDPYPKANPSGALTGVSIALILRLLIFLGFLKFIRQSRQSSSKKKWGYLALGILLLILGIIYLDGAFAFLDNKDIPYVSVLMFAGTGCDAMAAVLIILAFFINPQIAEKKFSIAEVPAWAMSLITFFLPIVLYVLFEILQIPASYTIAAIIIFVIIVTAACFFICKTHPKSVWYTPLICQGFLIIFIIKDVITGYAWTAFTDWITMLGIVLLSVIAAIVGARIGRRITKQST